MRRPKRKPIFKAPAPKKAPQIHRPAKGKGSFRRRPRTARRDRDAP